MKAIGISRRRLLPIALTMLAMLAAGTTAARAGHWWWSNGQVVHLQGGHFPGFGFWNGADEDAEVRLRFEYSRGHWNHAPYLTIGEVANPAAAQVRAHDGFYGLTEWAGLATPQGWDGYHAAYFDIQANLTYMQDPGWTNTWQYKQKVTCHEIGHAVAGVDHSGVDQPGCMIAGRADLANSDQRFRTPGAHDQEHIRHLWGTLH